MNTYKKALLVLFVAAFTLCSCSQQSSSRKNLLPYSVGVIETSSQTGRTNFVFYDSALAYVQTLQTKYGLVGQFSYGMPFVQDSVMYELSLGNDYTKDFGTVLGLTLSTGSITEYKFDRVNLTDLVVTSDYIYTISNLNRTTYIDRYSFKTKTIDSVEAKGKFLLDLCLFQNELYAFGGDTSSYHMYRIDFSKQTYIDVYNLSKWYVEQGDPNYFAEYKDHLFFPCQDKLLQYSASTNQIQEYPLPYDNSRGLSLQDDTLYISCADRFSENDHSKIVVFDLKTEKVLTTYEFDTSIMQFAIKQNMIYILNQSGLYQYSMDPDSTCSLKAHTALHPSGNDLHVSAMFFNNTN